MRPSLNSVRRCRRDKRLLNFTALLSGAINLSGGDVYVVFVFSTVGICRRVNVRPERRVGEDKNDGLMG